MTAPALDRLVENGQTLSVECQSALGSGWDCEKCLRAEGRLCAFHAVHVLPQLAVNLGWLRLMGEAMVEQVKRQTVAPTLTAKERYAVARVARREARKAARRGNGAMRLTKAIQG